MALARHSAGLVGAGHISRFHAAALSRLPGVTLVGVYDLDPDRAHSLADELGSRAVSSIEELAAAGADVIHVLTPPESHAAVALEALERGCHVLVEKPLATDVADCRRIAQTAVERGLSVCVDHSLLYDRYVMRALRDIRAGAIGRPVCVDVSRSAEYPPYEGGALPPQYRSGGYPFRDLGIHQLYLIAALLGPIEDVRADWSSLGGEPNLAFDEWRAEVRCRDGAGRFHISFNIKPIQNIIIVQGTKGLIRIEPMSMFFTKRVATPLPKAAQRVLTAYGEALSSAIQVSAGIAGFLTKRARQYDGVQTLIAEFYRALDAGLPMPAGVEDAAPAVNWVEKIARAADADAALRAQHSPQAHNEVPILLTGAAGALGGAIADRLLLEGVRFRAFVRQRGVKHISAGTEIATGDLGDPAAVDAAVKGARIVVHAGAATAGSWVQQRTSTVVGTQNIIDACLRHGVEQLVYISSLSVVDWGGDCSEAINERTALEPRPHLRGAYTQAKLEAETEILRAVKERGLRVVILRPGQIFGGKLRLLNAAVARRVLGRWIVLGSGNIRLPLVYVDDVVDAVLAAIERRLASGEIIQLVDEHLPTQNEILERALGRGDSVLHIPRPLLFAFGALSEAALYPLGRQSPLSRYRLRSALANRKFASAAATELLEWSPRIGVYAGIERMLPAATVPPIKTEYARSN